ncbi:MAG TPA: hypothetical protein VFD90_08645 [Gaiellales bacterium]|jgi:hypothetical protein|nr:hypothetical protein [Gaiellales bacterium]
MPRRALIRLVRLLAVACACLAPAAAAQAQPPTNDTKTTAQVITSLPWTSLSLGQDVPVGAADWTDATTGPEDADPLPSCTGAVGFRSTWYAVPIPEAAVLRVTVSSTDTSRYQPVVTILDPSNQEVACGVAAIGKAGATANATAYVTPAAAGQPSPAMYVVRVAQILNNSASGGLPNVIVNFAGRDVTPPHIVVHSPGKVQPKTPVEYNAEDTKDLASGVLSAHWEFTEKRDGHNVTRLRDGPRVNFTWLSQGAHDVTLTVTDRALNESMYRFTTVVQDTVRPDVKFSLRPPAPGAHRLRIIVKASESVHVRLLVTQVGRRKPLLRTTITFWGDSPHSRSIPLTGGVRKGLLVIGGVARDLAGNATSLPQFVVDPVTGQGTSASP